MFVVRHRICPTPTHPGFSEKDIWHLEYNGCTVRPRVVLAGSFPYTIAIGYLVEPAPLILWCLGGCGFSHSPKVSIWVFIVVIGRLMEILSSYAPRVVSGLIRDFPLLRIRCEKENQSRSLFHSIFKCTTYTSGPSNFYTHICILCPVFGLYVCIRGRRDPMYLTYLSYDLWDTCITL